jgi:type 1 glutamine amidotransferase
LVASAAIGSAAGAGVPADQLEKMKAAAPDKAPAAPQKARKLLVYTATKGFRHSSIPLAAESLKFLGEKTKAYQSVITDDSAMFNPEKLAEFDAVCFDQCTGSPFTEADRKAALLDFVRSGKGFIGIHAATDCFYDWKDFGDLIGGYFAGHPFGRISVKLDAPKNPINAAFGGKGFEISDEIYTFRDPYSRRELRILLSVDWENSGELKGGTRKDNDYALSWIREYGKGRVFYCAFGHVEPIWWNPQILAHYLAGVQYALGDLKAIARPGAKSQPARGPKLGK